MSARLSPSAAARRLRAQPPRWRWLWAAWWGLLLGGLAMAGWAAAADHFPADIAAGRWIQAHDVAGQDVIDFVRDVGSTNTALVAILVVAAALALGRRRRMAAVAVAFVLALVFQTVLKDVVGRPRTSIEFLEERTGFSSPSFPSGHVMSGVIVAGLVVYLSLRLAGPVWVRAGPAVWVLGVALLNPWVSITSGVHWPSDALGGIVWGLVVVIPGLALLERARRAHATARGDP